MINVLLVDDHKLVRKGIMSLLQDIQGIKVVGEASNGEDAISLAREVKPHVILMDVKMPYMDGFQATRKLLRFDPDVKILVVTICTNDLYPARLLQLGASGYITKGASQDDMVQAIRAVHSGQRYISSEIASQLALKHVTERDQSIFDLLSERELEVMLMITKGYKVQDIAEKLCLSPKTVNSYRYRIFEKLNVKNDVELTLLAVRTEKILSYHGDDVYEILNQRIEQARYYNQIAIINWNHSFKAINQQQGIPIVIGHK